MISLYPPADTFVWEAKCASLVKILDVLLQERICSSRSKPFPFGYTPFSRRAWCIYWSFFPPKNGRNDYQLYQFSLGSSKHMPYGIFSLWILAVSTQNRFITKVIYISVSHIPPKTSCELTDSLLCNYSCKNTFHDYSIEKHVTMANRSKMIWLVSGVTAYTMIMIFF